MADYTHICVQGTIHCSPRGHRTSEAADRCAARRNSVLRSLGLLTDDNRWIVRTRIQPLKDLDYKDLFRDAVNMMAHIARAAGFDPSDPTVEPPAIVARVENLRAEVERLTAERAAVRAALVDSGTEPVTEDMGRLAALVAAQLADEVATIARLTAELEETRLTLAAEQGRTEGAPSTDWAFGHAEPGVVGLVWFVWRAGDLVTAWGNRGERTAGGWSRWRPDERGLLHIDGSINPDWTDRAAMLAADAARPASDGHGPDHGQEVTDGIRRSS